MCRTKNHVVLVGPVGVGKTPVSEILAKELKFERFEGDTMEYRRISLGWSADKYQELTLQGLIGARDDYNSQFSVPLIRDLIEGCPAAVIDCGGDEFVTSNREKRCKMRSELNELDSVRVAGILPSPDPDETLEFYYNTPEIPEADVNEFMYKTGSYQDVADKVFYRKDKSLELLADEILKWLKG